MTVQKQSDTQIATRVTLVGALLDLVLGVLKISLGLVSNSIALVSDGIHSLSDLGTDAFVLFISRVSHAKPDRNHPYGHRRFETLGTIVLGIVLFAVAAVICFDSVRRLYQLDPLPVPGWTGLLVAAVSIGAKEWIYRYTKKVADQIGSSLLLANAWHSRTDALSSIAVFIGISGALLGFPAMDVLAAIFVAAMIAWIAYKLVGESLRELVDTALPQDEVAAMRDHVRNIEGILDTHELRTRRHGGRTFVDLHVQVNDHISVSEGHYLAERTSASLRQAFPDIGDIVVHIDPEPDDASLRQDMSLPLRHEIRASLVHCWRDVLADEDIKRLVLHYLENQVEVEVFIDKTILNNEIEDKLYNLLKDLKWLKKVSFYAHP